MNFRFSTTQVFLVVAIIAINLGGIMALRSGYGWPPGFFPVAWTDIWNIAAYGLIVWLPAIFVAYAVGRRRLSISLIVLLALAELAALLAVWVAIQ